MELKHSGFIAVVGRPSSGKSTFLNTLCGFKVSIVSPTPQTTRCRVRAIYNEEGMQLVFIDTPGMHFSEKKYNQELVSVARYALSESEAVLYLSDLSRPFGNEDKMILEVLKPYASKTIAALNKMDLPGDSPASREAAISKFMDPAAFIAFSATDRDQSLTIAREVANMLPEGALMYPEDFYTDQTQEFRISEIIREKVFIHMRQEIPHSVYTKVDKIRYSKEKQKLRIEGVIFVESESQKSMVIGKGGAMIKRILNESRTELRGIWGLHINLLLKVKVHKNWRKDPTILKRLMQQ